MRKTDWSMRSWLIVPLLTASMTAGICVVKSVLHKRSLPARTAWTGGVLGARIIGDSSHREIIGHNKAIKPRRSFLRISWTAVERDAGRSRSILSTMVWETRTAVAPASMPDWNGRKSLSVNGLIAAGVVDSALMGVPVIAVAGEMFQDASHLLPVHGTDHSGDIFRSFCRRLSEAALVNKACRIC